MNVGLAYLFGLLTLPAGIALGASVAAVGKWWRYSPPNRLAAWRTWRIKRLRRKADLIARLTHTVSSNMEDV